MDPVPETSRERESSEVTLFDDFNTLSSQRQAIIGQPSMTPEQVEQCSSDGNSHPLGMASPIPNEFHLLVVAPDPELQDRNYVGNNEEPSSLVSFPSPTLGLVTREPRQSFRQAEIISTRSNQQETSLQDGSNTSGQQAWKIGGNFPDPSSPISRPQTPFPHSAMGLGLGHGGRVFHQTLRISQPQTPFFQAMGLGGRHGGPYLTDQVQENWVAFNQTNPYEASSATHQSISEAPNIPNVFNAHYSEAPIRSHQFFAESPIIPMAIDAQYSSSVTTQQATPIWSHAMSQQQINDQVLVAASSASAHASVNEFMSSTENSIPFWRSLYPGQHEQPNQLPLLDVGRQSHYTSMHETSMIIGPQDSAAYQTVNQAPSVQTFGNNSGAGTLFLPSASPIPQRAPFASPLGFSNEAPRIIPNSNAGQSQFMNPEMDGGSCFIGNPNHSKAMDSNSQGENRKRYRLGDSTYEEGQSSSSAKHLRLDGITQEQSHSWLNLGPANSGSQPQGNDHGGIIDINGGIINRVYDPMYERLGLPIDPHLRMFLASQIGNPSSSGQTVTLQFNNQPQTWRLPDKRS